MDLHKKFVKYKSKTYEETTLSNKWNNQNSISKSQDNYLK